MPSVQYLLGHTQYALGPVLARSRPVLARSRPALARSRHAPALVELWLLRALSAGPETGPGRDIRILSTGNCVASA
eukprot:1232888-Rhodomonas_salina.3